MKLLLVLAAVGLLVWLLRGGSRRGAVRRAEAAAAARAAAATPQHMVRCAACGLHLPAAEALEGPDGRRFCSTEHLRGPA